MVQGKIAEDTPAQAMIRNARRVEAELLMKLMSALPIDSISYSQPFHHDGWWIFDINVHDEQITFEYKGPIGECNVYVVDARSQVVDPNRPTTKCVSPFMALKRVNELVAEIQVKKERREQPAATPAQG